MLSYCAPAFTDTAPIIRLFLQHTLLLTAIYPDEHAPTSYLSALPTPSSALPHQPDPYTSL